MTHDNPGRRTDVMDERIVEHIRCAEALRAHVHLIERVAGRIADCFRSGGRVYLLGNGGSAADAQHIAAELVGRFKVDRRALPACALTTDTSILTAVTNDLGADVCFARQVEAWVKADDMVWALSVSGTSPNVVAALEATRAIGAGRIGFTGRSGGQFPALCDLCLQVDHDDSDRVQEIHQLAYHLVCDRIDTLFA